MVFQVSSRYKLAAAMVNNLPIDKFPLLITSLLQKLHIKNSRLFTEDEENKLLNLFNLTTNQLNDVLDCLSYTFEQSAFTSTGPEELYEILLSGDFDEPHAKVVGRSWAAEAAGYVAKLKDQRLGYRSLNSVDYRLNMVMHESDLLRQQEPVAIFELKIKDQVSTVESLTNNNKDDDENKKKNAKEETLQLEFNHSELYAFFSQLERLQQQVDALSKG